MRLFAAAILATFVLFASHPVAAAADAGPTVKVLVVFPETAPPSKVYFATDGEFTRGLLIPFAALANSGNLAKRSKQLGADLDLALAGYDRHQVMFDALRESFAQRSPMFALTLTRARSAFLKGDKPNKSAKQDGFAYVLVIDEVFSGLSMLNTLATRSDDVAPMSTISYRLFETGKNKLLLKGSASGNGMEKMHISEAPRNRELFVAAYPEMVRLISMQLVGSLFRSDNLHAMAASVGRGAEVPKVSSLMKSYEKRFSYRITPPDGWKRTRMNSKFVEVIEPKTDLRYRLGLRFDVDLLLPELGQGVESVEEYLVPMSERLADAGIDVSTLAEFDGIELPNDYRVYAYDANTDGGRNIIALRLLGGNMIEVVTIVVLKDFEVLFPQHRKVLESTITNAKLRVNKA